MPAPETTLVPTDWLARVLGLLTAMAGEGAGMQDCADPADLMYEIAEHMGLGGEDDPWAAVANAMNAEPTNARP